MIDTFKPITDLLGGQGTWITTVLVWIAAISAVLSPFAVWIRNKLADALNRAAQSSDLDDDAYLTKLFSASWYKAIAFLLNFANIRLPVLSELQRAIKLQQEEVKKVVGPNA